MGLVYVYIIIYYFIVVYLFVLLFAGVVIAVAVGDSFAWSFRAAGGRICWVIGPLFCSGLLVRSGFWLTVGEAMWGAPYLGG